ncbi:hypothetical protein CLIB1444_05S05314 [[Candida] jaroonii]|uniref:Uncharacterized protein n=1 Tax=[Candida] jaroonii TaxID=467808 RepID=A0ACA9Y8I8_9ASCO|nr:hypothetical protein CLIB1444_05S05314 [[Candida] jaroonii]
MAGVKAADIVEKVFKQMLLKEGFCNERVSSERHNEEVINEELHNMKVIKKRSKSVEGCRKSFCVGQSAHSIY